MPRIEVTHVVEVCGQVLKVVHRPALGEIWIGPTEEASGELASHVIERGVPTLTEAQARLWATWHAGFGVRPTRLQN